MGPVANATRWTQSLKRLVCLSTLEFERKTFARRVFLAAAVHLLDH